MAVVPTTCTHSLGGASRGCTAPIAPHPTPTLPSISRTLSPLVTPPPASPVTNGAAVAATVPLYCCVCVVEVRTFCFYVIMSCSPFEKHSLNQKPAPGGSSLLSLFDEDTRPVVADLSWVGAVLFSPRATAGALSRYLPPWPLPVCSSTAAPRVDNSRQNDMAIHVHNG